MILNNIKSRQKDSGFTIVELLVVIVVIGILAAIIIVSYAGITQKANNARSLSNASQVLAVSDAFFAENNYYPATNSTTAMTTADWSSRPTTAKLPAGITVATPAVTTLSAANGASTITVSCVTTCTGTTGLRIGYWDFVNSAILYLYDGAATVGSTYVNPAS